MDEQLSRQIWQRQTWIQRLQEGDPTARNELLNHSCERLRRLARRMLRDFARLKRWEDTDDTPSSARHFYALAALQIRRELIDLARQYYGPEGIGAKHASNVQADPSTSMPQAGRVDSTMEPSRLAVWSEFHQRVDTLPEQEREVFDLLWYRELTQAEAAALLGISEATLKRRWLAARRRLHQTLKGGLPGT
jgi:RNA polymerase sigma factor (sigma-70 family)